MYQGQCEHLREYCSVVRMPHEAKWAGGDHAEARRVHHLNIPVIAKRANDPPAHDIGHQENRKRYCRENGNEGPLEHNDFQAAPSNTAVCSATIQRNFGSETFAAPRETSSLMMAPRNFQFEKA